MKKLLLISTISFLLSSCAPPIEEGVYFEVGGKSYQTSENPKIAFGGGSMFGPDNYAPMGCSVLYENNDFRFRFNTTNFYTGKYYFGEVYQNEFSVSFVYADMLVKNGQIASTGNYTVDATIINEENYAEIIHFDENLVELRFQAILTQDNYPHQQIKLKNGYFKMPL